MSISQRFTSRTQLILAGANQRALDLQHEYIETEHILLALISETSGDVPKVLETLEADPRKIRLEVGKMIQAGPDPVSSSQLPQTPRTKNVFKFAAEEADALGHDRVDAAHILLGLLREEKGVVFVVLQGLGVTLENAREAIRDQIGYGLDDVSLAIDVLSSQGRVFDEEEAPRRRQFRRLQEDFTEVLEALAVAQKMRPNLATLQILRALAEELRAKGVTRAEFKARVGTGKIPKGSPLRNAIAQVASSLRAS